MHIYVTIYIIITRNNYIYYASVNCCTIAYIFWCLNEWTHKLLCVSIYKMIWSVICSKFDMQHDLPNRIV